MIQGLGNRGPSECRREGVTCAAIYLEIYLEIYRPISKMVSYLKRSSQMQLISVPGALDILCVEYPRKVDIRLPGKGNSNSPGARPVY